MDRTSWANFNECLDLRYCKKHHIRLSGPRLGRPPKETPENAARLRAEATQARQDELDRIPIEGKFGQGKRRFSIGRLMTKLASTSEMAIALCFLVMNLEKWLAAISLCLYVKKQKLRLQNTWISCWLHALHGRRVPIPIS